MCLGLRQGIWPYANPDPDAPQTVDNSERQLDSAATSFIRTQRDAEIALDRFLPDFGTDLLPGMYSSPISAVPKPHSTDLHMVTDQSNGKNSLNSWILRADAAIRLDNLQDFGTSLCTIWERDGCPPYYLFKSDASQAFRRMPMAFLWQIRQIVTVDGRRHVDRCMVFGGHSAPRIWCLFMRLVIWIAIHIILIEDLLHYMDDAWSYDTNPTLVYYAPYDAYYPSKQVRLLLLWDDIGLPHEKKKQVFGRSLDIIGLHVDPHAMTITMPTESKLELVSAIRTFISTTTMRRHALVEWQRLLGWINWALNAFPLLRPGLQSSYAKITGKTQSRAQIYINHMVIRDLSWVANVVEAGNGICLLDAVAWDLDDAVCIVFCDASLGKMGFYCPAMNVGYCSPIPDDTAVRTIFFYEALCVTSALLWASQLPQPPRRLLIYTDSLNTVEMFYSLRAMEGYNDLLLLAVRILMDASISLQVAHIPGVDNVVADALSRGLFELAESLHPGLLIRLFQPPRDALGVAQL